MVESEKTLWIIAGPTLTGKSSIAGSLSKTTPCRIINADSMQIYKGLPILTAQPEYDENNRLYNIWTSGNSVYQWKKEAEEEIRISFAEGFQPICVGGAGFYLDSLMNGISNIPDIPKEISDNIANKSQEEVLNELLKISPESDISENHRRRCRALAVFCATGKSMSHWHRVSEKSKANLKIKGVVLFKKPCAEEVAARFREMLEKGAIEEVVAFESANPGEHQAKKAIGFAEIVRYCEGEINMQSMIDRVVTRTTQYAKRQMTWFKRRHNPLTLLCDISSENVRNILKQEFLSDISGYAGVMSDG